MKKVIQLLAGIALMSGLLFTSCSKDDEDTTYTQEGEKKLLNEYIAYVQEKGYDVDTTANGVFYITLEQGTGAYPKQGDKLEVAYTGKFIGGVAFDTSGDPATNGYFTFTHKVDRMIPGWEEGMESIKEGGKALLIVPSTMAYGATGNYGIPPYTTLLFEIYLHDVVSPEN